MVLCCRFHLNVLLKFGRAGSGAKVGPAVWTDRLIKHPCNRSCSNKRVLLPSVKLNEIGGLDGGALRVGFRTSFKGGRNDIGNAEG